MKNLIIILLMQVLTIVGYAQTLSKDVQKVYDACVKLSNSIGTGNISGIRSANKELKKCPVKPFVMFQNMNENPLSVDGHFVFDEVFVDSLLTGRDVYKFASRYVNKDRRGRLDNSNIIFTKTCVVRGGESEKYMFISKGHQELAFVTEPSNTESKKGMISVRIYDKTHDKWYNDTEQVKTGKPTRVFVLDLPSNENTCLIVEVINCEKKDISFVVISN